MTPPSQVEYLIGWICVLPEEYFAARSILDEQYDSSHTVRGRRDRTTYMLGRMGQHPVVINRPPASQYGEIHASSIAHGMRSTSVRIRFVLLVGIGGGVSLTEDIRLGDVVLGTEVIPYASGKNTIFGFQRTGRIAYPPQVLLDAITGLEERLRFGGLKLSRAIDDIKIMNEAGHNIYARPRGDKLFDKAFQHEGVTCPCLKPHVENSSNTVRRPQRIGDLVKTHKGKVGSADAVMKNAGVRDDLATREGLICFEMEAAGVMHITPCLPIRGVSDYSDSHKNDQWHPYAVLAAAVCAKEILDTMSPHDVMRSPLDLDTKDLAEYVKDGTTEIARYGNDIDSVRQKLTVLMERYDLIEDKLGPELDKLKDQSCKDIERVHKKVEQYKDMQEHLKHSLAALQVKISEHLEIYKTQDFVTREEWLSLQTQVAQNTYRMEKLSAVTHGALGTTARLLGDIGERVDNEELNWASKWVKYASEYGDHITRLFMPQNQEPRKNELSASTSLTARGRKNPSRYKTRNLKDQIPKFSWMRKGSPKAEATDISSSLNTQSFLPNNRRNVSTTTATEDLIVFGSPTGSTGSSPVQDSRFSSTPPLDWGSPFSEVTSINSSRPNLIPERDIQDDQKSKGHKPDEISLTSSTPIRVPSPRHATPVTPRKATEGRIGYSQVPDHNKAGPQHRNAPRIFTSGNNSTLKFASYNPFRNDRSTKGPLPLSVNLDQVDPGEEDPSNLSFQQKMDLFR